MINPNKRINTKGKVVKVGPSWLFIELKTGTILESELMNVSGYKVGDHVKGTANYSIVGESYVVRDIKHNKGKI